MRFTKHAKKILLAILFLLPFFIVNKASALTIEGEWIDRAHIKITRFEVTRDDLNQETKDIIDNELGGGDNALRVVQENASKNIVGTYEDDNMGDSEDRWLKSTGCGGQGQRTAITFDGGMVIDSNNLYINFPGIDCKKILERGIALSLGKGERAEIYFVASKDGKSLARVDKNPDSEPPYAATPGNAQKFFSKKSGDCDVAVTLDEDLKTGDANQLTGAHWQACTGDPKSIKVAATAAEGGGGGGGDDGGTGEEGGAAPPSCESNNSNVVMSWLLCGVINFVDDTINKLASSVDGLLDVQKEEYDVKEYKEIWSYFKNISSFLLVALALVAIIGQAVRGD